MEIVAKLIADYIIIHRDNSEIGEYISYLENNDWLAKGIGEINEATINFHINYMRIKFSQISDDEIFNKIYDNYETNGFLFQGINGNFINSAEQNGLTGSFSTQGIKCMKRQELQQYNEKNDKNSGFKRRLIYYRFKGNLLLMVCLFYNL